jgi:HD-like signal output (HDOD) protein
MNQPHVQPATGETSGLNVFGFVQMLATELSQGRVNLPGIPEVALRVQRVLNDENARLHTVVQAVNAEPTLAVQIMRMANSAALSTGAPPVTDVRAAVRRVGTQMIRAAALSFLVEQLKNAEELRPLRTRLNALWLRGVVVGVLGRALAGKVEGVSPDAALLAGLLHVVGRLYILTRLQYLPPSLAQPAVAEKAMADWSGSIAKALLENWDMPPEYGEAVAGFDNPYRDSKGSVELADILAGAVVLADVLVGAKGGEVDAELLGSLHAQHEELWRRLGLAVGDCGDAVHSALRDAQEFRALFGT